jgi:hypothetical protein
MFQVKVRLYDILYCWCTTRICYDIAIDYHRKYTIHQYILERFIATNNNQVVVSLARS